MASCSLAVLLRILCPIIPCLSEATSLGGGGSQGGRISSAKSHSQNMEIIVSIGAYPRWARYESMCNKSRGRAAQDGHWCGALRPSWKPQAGRTPAPTETLLREERARKGCGRMGWDPRRTLRCILKLLPKETGKAWLTGTSCLGGWGIQVWGQSWVAEDSEMQPLFLHTTVSLPLKIHVRLKVLFLFLVLKRWGRPSQAAAGLDGGREALESGRGTYLSQKNYGAEWVLSVRDHGDKVLQAALSHLGCLQCIQSRGMWGTHLQEGSESTLKTLEKVRLKREGMMFWQTVWSPGS